MLDKKFRAWDDHEKKWLLGYSYPNLGGFSLTGETVLFGEWGDVFDQFIFRKNGKEPKHLIIEQFIGVKDKNQKEIYEGDKVKCVHQEGMAWEKNYTDIGVVEFSNGSFVIRCPKKGCEHAKDVSKRTFILHFNPKREFEVIGNIHENNLK